MLHIHYHHTNALSLKELANVSTLGCEYYRLQVLVPFIKIVHFKIAYSVLWYCTVYHTVVVNNGINFGFIRVSE